MGGQSIRMNDFVKLFGEEKITQWIKLLKEYGEFSLTKKGIQIRLLSWDRFEYSYVVDWHLTPNIWSINEIYNFCLSDAIGKDCYRELVNKYVGFRVFIGAKWLEKRQVYFDFMHGAYPLQLQDKYGIKAKSLQRRAQRYKKATNSSNFVI